MSEQTFEDTVRKISKMILINEHKMVREEDLIQLCPESINFDQVINHTYQNLIEMGFELITSTFLDQKYYILTSEGKDDDITPTQYGILAMFLALSKEVDENLKYSDMKKIFSEVWDNVELLIEKDFIRKISIRSTEILKMTPLGKALLKNVIQNINLKTLLDVFKKE
jgi:predicted transcriptional regulator